MPMWWYIFIYFCDIWAFSSSRKHLLITLLRLEFVVFVHYFSIYFYLCNFNHSLFVFFFVYLLVFSVCEGLLGLFITHGVVKNRAQSSVGTGWWQPFQPWHGWLVSDLVRCREIFTGFIILLITQEAGSVVGIAIRQGTRRSGFLTPVGKSFLSPGNVHTGSWAQPASYSMDSGVPSWG